MPTSKLKKVLDNCMILNDVRDHLELIVTNLKPISNLIQTKFKRKMKTSK